MAHKYIVDTHALIWFLEGIPEMHDRFIVSTGLYLQDLGHTIQVLTKDESITDAGVLPIIW